MSALFSPYQLGHLSLKNRIVIAPMCQYSATEGLASDWHLIHLGQMALSGAALLIIEATAVEPIGRISSGDLGLWSDQTEAALQKTIASLRQYTDMRLSVQLAHAGRKASTDLPWRGGKQVPPEHGGWPAVAPSALPFHATDPAPMALAATDLARIKQAFSDAAKRAHRLGLDSIELHSAHGYLLHQFLSPLSNQRTDQYGGSLAKRMRFPLEVFEAMRDALPAGYPLGVRLSASDWVEGGWDIEQSVAFSLALKERGAAYIHASSGGLSPQQAIATKAGYQLHFAERLRAETNMPVIAVGLITQPAQAESVVATGQADLVALARAMLFEPHWPWRAAAELGAQVDVPPQYLRSVPQAWPQLYTALRSMR